MIKKVTTLAAFYIIFLAAIFSAFSLSGFTGFLVASAVPDSKLLEIATEEKINGSRVYLGGQPVGFNLDIDGVIVTEIGEVDTAAGKATLKSPIVQGDIIEEIEGEKINDSDDIKDVLNKDGEKREFSVKIRRGGEKQEFKIYPLIERLTGLNKLGLAVKGEIGGIGTVTYIKQDGRFAALGHAVCSCGTGAVEINGGKVYECRISGLEKGRKGKAGTVKGSLVTSKMLGSVDKNIKYGIYGKIDAPDGTLYEVAGRSEVSAGKARICSALSGKKEFYDIEIVKAVNQNGDSEKGMVIKIRDQRLLDMTGGIIQGMSGSPILQNNKIIGAVTHVFINDPTRGYGIYLDWMLNN